MISWLIGENSFEIREALLAIEAAFNGTPEHIDATELNLAQLPDLLMGISLFASERLVVLRDLTRNASLWEKLPDWLPRISDAIHLVLIDEKPDKRTTSYKALKAAANDVHEFPKWTDRDTAKAQQWLGDRATLQGIVLGVPTARHLIERVGLDQWQLAHAVETLALLDEVTPHTIDAIIPANPRENIFQLFETALEGKRQQVVESLAVLSLSEDPYAFFALLSSQVMSLAAVTYADEKQGDTAVKDFGLHPFVASKLTRHGQKLGKAKVGHILETFAQADADLKRSRGEPWLIIEKTLLAIV